MKSLRIVFVAMFVLVSTSLAEKVATMPAPTAYVDDYAGVMTSQGKTEVEAICREVHDKTKAQIFVVTIKSLEGETVATFANELFHQWKIGEKKTDRGILVLFVSGDRKWRIEVGYGLEGILPDGMVGRIGRDMVPALKDADYDEAARVGVQAIASVIADDAKVSLDSVSNAPSELPATSPEPLATPVSASTMNSFFNAAGGLFIFVWFAIIGFAVWKGWKRRGQPGTGGSSGTFSGGSDDSSSGDSGGSDSFSGGDGGDSGGGGADGSF